MIELIGAMGADHITQDKLTLVVKKMEIEAKLGDPFINRLRVNDRIRSEYGFSSLDAKYADREYVAEEKFDGYSYLCDGGRFFSKRLSEAKGHEGEPIEKTEWLPHLSSAIRSVSDLLGIDLHGELYVPGGISDDVTKIMGCTADEAVRRQENNGKLHYRLLDIRKFNNKSVINEPYYVRRALLEYVYDSWLSNYSTIDIAPVELLPREMFRRIVTNGGEGIIIKKTNAPYTPWKKPAGVWIKCKKKITFEAVIMGYKAGTGKNASMFGSIEFGLYDGGQLRKMGFTSSGLNDATRAIIAANPDSFINTVMEIEAIQASRTSFRNAVFLRLRDDKGASECTLESIKPKEEIL